MSEGLLQKPSGCSSPPSTSTVTCPVPAPAGRNPEQQRVQQHPPAPHELAEPPAAHPQTPRAARGALQPACPPFLGPGGNYRFSSAKQSLIAAKAGGIDFLFCFKCS